MACIFFYSVFSIKVLQNYFILFIEMLNKSLQRFFGFGYRPSASRISGFASEFLFWCILKIYGNTFTQWVMFVNQLSYKMQTLKTAKLMPNQYKFGPQTWRAQSEVKPPNLATLFPLKLASVAVDCVLAPEEWLGHGWGLHARGADHDADGAQTSLRTVLGRSRPLPPLSHRSRFCSRHQQFQTLQDGRHHHRQVGFCIAQEISCDA